MCFMNIAQITLRYPPSIGGVEDHVYHLSEELSKKGHNVTIYTSFLLDNVKEDRQLQSVEQHNKIVVKRYPFLKLINNRDSTYIQPRIFVDIKKNAPEVIHVHGFRYFPVYGSILFKSFSKIPTIATTHHNPNLNVTLLQRLHDLMFMRRLRKLRQIITVTDFEREFFAKRIGSDKVVTIPNGIPDDFIKLCDEYIPQKAKLKELMGLTKTFTITFLGRVSPLKGLETIIKALAALPSETRKEITFLICGPVEPNYKSKILLMSNDLDVRGNIKFLDPIFDNDSKARLLCASDLFVFPSISEVFGIVLLEALAARLPILSSNLQTIASFMNDNSSIIFLDPTDYSEWGRNIQLLMSNNFPVEKLEVGRKMVENYRWSKLADDVVKIYCSGVM